MYYVWCFYQPDMFFFLYSFGFLCLIVFFFVRFSYIPFDVVAVAGFFLHRRKANWAISIGAREIKRLFMNNIIIIRSDFASAFFSHTKLCVCVYFFSLANNHIEMAIIFALQLCFIEICQVLGILIFV